MLWSLWNKAWQFLIPMRNEGVCPHKNLHTNVLSSLIHNSQKAETTQMSINKWKDKQNVVYPYNWVLFGHKKEWSANTHYKLDEYWRQYDRWRKPVIKIMQYMFLFIKKYPRDVSIHKVGQWLSRTGGLGELEAITKK